MRAWSRGPKNDLPLRKEWYIFCLSAAWPDSGQGVSEHPTAFPEGPSRKGLSSGSLDNEKVGDGRTWTVSGTIWTWCQLAFGWMEQTWFVHPDLLQKVFGHPLNWQHKAWKLLHQEPCGIGRELQIVRQEDQMTKPHDSQSTKKNFSCRLLFQLHPTSKLATWICLKHNKMKDSAIPQQNGRQHTHTTILLLIWNHPNEQRIQQAAREKKEAELAKRLSLKPRKSRRSSMPRKSTSWVLNRLPLLRMLLNIHKKIVSHILSTQILKQWKPTKNTFKSRKN